MDIDIVYNEIVEKLKTTNNQNVLVGLENSLAGAATGSEALMSSASYLLSLKHSHRHIYDLLRDQIKDYLKYCRENGLAIS
jgi:hypothetical protein